MTAHPTKLERLEGNQLLIAWSDGQQRRYSLRELREKCPCATCRERRQGEAKKPANVLPVLSAAEAQPLAITGMRPVGNYAYNIQFNDGHDTGIYTFEFLRELGEKVEP